MDTGGEKDYSGNGRNNIKGDLGKLDLLSHMGA